MEQDIRYPHPPPQYTPNEPVVLQPTAIPHPPVQIVHVHQNPPMGPQPAIIICPNCHRNVLTNLEYKATIRTHGIAVVLCLFGLIPCAVIPYFMKSCQNGNHYCPSCNYYIGTYSN